jgi:hypothetical protein
MILAAAVKPTVMINKRIGGDSERVKRAFKKLKSASNVKRDRLIADLKSAIEAIDRVAKEEVEFLQAVFDENESIDVSVDFEETDDVVVFNYDGDDDE